MTRPMTVEELSQHRYTTQVIRQVVSALRLVSFVDTTEDLEIALARCENWLSENDGRWTT